MEFAAAEEDETMRSHYYQQSLPTVHWAHLSVMYKTSLIYSKLLFPCTPSISTQQMALHSLAWKCNLTFISSKNALVDSGCYQNSCYPGWETLRAQTPEHLSGLCFKGNKVAQICSKCLNSPFRSLYFSFHFACSGSEDEILAPRKPFGT